MGFHIIIRTYLLFDKYEKPYSFGKFGFLKEAWGFSQESIINFFFEPKKLFFFLLVENWFFQASSVGFFLVWGIDFLGKYKKFFL